MDLWHRLTRRQFLSTLGSAALGAGLALGASPRSLRAAPLLSPLGRSPGLNHVVWVWQFSEDGPPEAIRGLLAQYSLGVAVKTHDGTHWMSEYDRSPHAISGPSQVARLAEFFEDAGVPFHAWCVVQGVDSGREAAMGAEVLAAGVRSLILDLEPHAGFWRGTPSAAGAFGRELRRRQPQAWVSTSMDPRPWLMDRMPLKEFASFSNELSPQIYWDSFNTEPNWRRFAESGRAPGPQGVTPAFLVSTAVDILSPYGLPIQPMGQGNTSREGAWTEFLESAFAQGAEAVSVWRLGVTRPDVWSLLKQNPPRPTKYAVQPGDTLSALAEQWNTNVSAIAEANGIEDPNFIYVGQELVVPRGARGSVPPVRAGGGVYTVQPGDNLTVLARRWGTTISRILNLNGLGNPDFIWIGQQLRIP